jgi:hypothetical protein
VEKRKKKREIERPRQFIEVEVGEVCCTFLVVGHLDQHLEDNLVVAR